MLCLVGLGDDVIALCLILLTSLPWIKLPAANGQPSSTTAWPLSATTVRLVGGVSDRDGKVQVFYQGQWGTICDDGWGILDAAVICRMLGFTGLAQAVPGSSGIFGAVPNNVTVWWRVVQCDGNEANIAFCPFQLNNGICSHQQDAGVVCLGTAASTALTTTPIISTTTLPPRICTNPSPNVRLVTSSLGGSSDIVGSAQGRVQVLYNGTWRAICDDLWGVQNAQVICRMLCFNPTNARATLGSSYYGNVTEGYWLRSVQCSGAETDITNCSRSGWGDSSVSACDATSPAGVSCLPDLVNLPPLPSPIITCNDELITAQFSSSTDPLLSPQSLSVGQSVTTGCGYATSQDSNSVSISIPFIGQCNTSRRINSSHVIYSNIVRYAVPSSSPVITRSTVYFIDVSCLMPRQANPVNDVVSNSRTPPPQTGSGLFNVQLLLFTDNTFQTTVASSTTLQVVLGDWIYVGVQLYTSDPSLKLVLNQCYASTTADPSSPTTYSLINNKCVVEPTLTLFPVNASLTAFRFQSFKFLTNGSSNVVFIHCLAYACALADSTGNCDASCTIPGQQSANGRRRRSTDRTAPVSIVSSPIVVMDKNANAGQQLHVAVNGRTSSSVVCCRKYTLGFALYHIAVMTICLVVERHHTDLRSLLRSI